jgi:hypothetical protein
VSVLVCRGCCCGTEEKHPSVDHDRQADLLRQAADAVGGRLRTVDCLGPCDRSNVVVVRSGTRRRWFGSILDEATTSALAAWVRDGAATAPPSLIRDLEFSPGHSPSVIVDELLTGPTLLDLLQPALDAGTFVTAGGNVGGDLSVDVGEPQVRAFGLRSTDGPGDVHPVVVLATTDDRRVDRAAADVDPEPDLLLQAGLAEVILPDELAPVAIVHLGPSA